MILRRWRWMFLFYLQKANISLVPTVADSAQWSRMGPMLELSTFFCFSYVLDCFCYGIKLLEKSQGGPWSILCTLYPHHWPPSIYSFLTTQYYELVGKSRNSVDLLHIQKR